MARYALNLPTQLKQDAEQLATEQGVSLNQFIQWAVAEKVGSLKQSLDDPDFPSITYRRGRSGVPTPVLRGRRVRVQSIVVAAQTWQMSPETIADQLDLSVLQVREALTFYEVHRSEIDADMAVETEIENRS